jgi:type VI secretion system protein ImpA
LKDARSSARSAERRADAEGIVSAALLPEWQMILSLAPKSIIESSKDLEIAAWLTEALVRAHGFGGLRSGLQLLRGLVERYWETFFSLEDEDGLETRLAPLAALNGVGVEGTLIQPLRKVPVTAQSGDDGPFALYHHDSAWTLSQVSDSKLRERREAAGEVTMQRFTSAVNASGGVFYIALLEELDGSLAELDALGKALDARAGRDSPSLSEIQAVLTTERDIVERVSRELVARARAVTTVNAPESRPGTNGSGNGLEISNGAVMGREDALRTLTRVADYFRQHEPHSPISTSLDEIVRRAHMPFPQLLAELLPDPAAWRSALISAGIKPPESG